MILIPGNQVTYREADKDFNRLNHFKVEEAGEKVAILALGDFYQRGEQLSAKIKAELGFTPTLINPRFASGIDKELLESLSERHWYDTGSDYCGYLQSDKIEIGRLEVVTPEL